MAKNTSMSQDKQLLEKHEEKLQALRQALSEGEESGNSGLLDMEAIRLEAKKEAKLIANQD